MDITCLSGCDPSGDREIPEDGDWELYAGGLGVGKSEFNNVSTSVLESIKNTAGEAGPLESAAGRPKC